MKIYLRNNWLLICFVLMLVGLSLLFILPNGQQIILIFSYLAASYLFIVGIAFLVTAFRFSHYLDNAQKQKREQIFLVLEALFLLVLGAIIIIFPTYAVRVLIGVTLILLPTIHLFSFSRSSKLTYLKRNFWKYLVGLIFILAVEAIIDYVFLVLGILLLSLAVYLIYLLIMNYRDVSRPNLIVKYSLLYLNERGRK
ncbi:MAG: hypothetical protein AB7T03_03510 [Bacilli bacterium]